MTVQSLESARRAERRAAAGTQARIGRIHWLLTVQTVVIVLLTVNRLSTLTTGYVAANQFLRWEDLHNILTLPVISLCAFYLLKRTLEAARPVAGEPAGLGLTFLLGTYLYGAGYGAHEVTNYLHLRFCADRAGEALSDLCRIVIFNDDSFSHWVWFTGFILINAALLLLQAQSPLAGRLGGRDLALLIANGLFIGAGIFANLAFEEIGLDLYVVAIVALLAIALLWRQGRRPLFVYYTTAYGLGLVATALYKLLA